MTCSTPLAPSRVWYAAAGRRTPRNAPLQHALELRRIRGFEALPPPLDSVLLLAMEVEATRLALGHAEPAALASLPGVGAEAVARVLALRAGRSVARAGWRRSPSLLEVHDGLSLAAQTELAPHMATVAARTTTVPDGWVVTVRATAGGWRARPGAGHVPRAGLDIHVVRAGTGIAVLRQAALP